MNARCNNCKLLIQKINQHEEIISQLVQMIAHLNKDMKRISAFQSNLSKKNEAKRLITSQ